MKKRQQIAQIKESLSIATIERDELMDKRMRKGISHDEFLFASDRITILSTTISTNKRKLRNLEAGYTAHGDYKPRMKSK
jgi:hypothetical protein